MTRYNFYEDGRPAQWNLLPRKSVFQFSREVELLDPIAYWAGPREDQYLIYVEPGIYDGFSVPWFAQILSGGALGPIMSGMSAAFVHDKACSDKLFTPKWRRDLFTEAYDAAMEQFYPDHDPDAWSNTVKRWVLVGSKYCSFC